LEKTPSRKTAAIGGEIPARRRRVAALEELGHRVDPAPDVERHEDPTENQENE
jgi:hypothetical protein